MTRRGLCGPIAVALAVLLAGAGPAVAATPYPSPSYDRVPDAIIRATYPATSRDKVPADPLNGEVDITAKREGRGRVAPGSRAAPAPAERAVRVSVLAPACAVDSPNMDRPLDIMCTNAATVCGVPGQILYWVFEGPPGVPKPKPGQWTQTGTRCISGPLPGTATPVLTATDFQRLPIPPANVYVQPADGHTLVNIETNLIADAHPPTLTTTILGQPVRVRPTPTRYHWTFGDHTPPLDTPDPGAPYPNLRTTHTYLDTGTFPLTLTTTYRGDYSIGGGPWLPIDGTAQVTSPPRQLTVLQARAVLVP